MFNTEWYDIKEMVRSFGIDLHLKYTPSEDLPIFSDGVVFQSPDSDQDIFGSDME